MGADHHTYFVGCDEWGFSVWAHNVYAKAEEGHAFYDRLRASGVSHDHAREIVRLGADERVLPGEATDWAASWSSERIRDFLTLSGEHQASYISRHANGAEGQRVFFGETPGLARTAANEITPEVTLAAQSLARARLLHGAGRLGAARVVEGAISVIDGQYAVRVSGEGHPVRNGAANPLPVPEVGHYGARQPGDCALPRAVVALLESRGTPAPHIGSLAAGEVLVLPGGWRINPDGGVFFRTMCLDCRAITTPHAAIRVAQVPEGVVMPFGATRENLHLLYPNTDFPFLGSPH